jgi:hypothetical protein
LPNGALSAQLRVLGGSMPINLELAANEATPEELPPELFALLERRMSTSGRSAYAAVHVPMPEPTGTPSRRGPIFKLRHYPPLASEQRHEAAD